MSYKSEAYAKAAETVMKKFEKRGMTAFYCPTKEEAKEKKQEKPIKTRQPKYQHKFWFPRKLGVV